MIRSIYSNSPHLTVTGGNPVTTYIGNTGGQGAGNIRFNTVNQAFEVYDGNAWVQLTSGYTTVGLFPNADAAIDWAIKKNGRRKKTRKISRNISCD